MPRRRAAESAREILSTRLEKPVEFSRIEHVVDYPEVHHCIHRAVLVDRDGPPSSVILKFPQKGGDSLYLERASLEFLGSNERTVDLVPTMYGCAEDAAVLVIEDLGDTDRLLGNILGSDDTTRAVHALGAMQEALARLHGLTSGSQAKSRFDEIRANYPPTSVSRHKIHRIDEALSEVLLRFEELRLDTSPGLLREVEQARVELREPRELLVFTHGDGTPANSVLVPDGSGDKDRVRFIDFETAGFRHAFLDGAFARLRYLHSVWARRIPTALRRDLQDRYRMELARHIPVVQDDDRYLAALGAACAGWLAGVLMFLPNIAAEDVRWGRSTQRERVLAALDHFVEFAEETAILPYLRDASEQAARALRTAWPDTAEMEPYEALESL